MMRTQLCKHFSFFEGGREGGTERAREGGRKGGREGGRKGEAGREGGRGRGCGGLGEEGGLCVSLRHIIVSYKMYNNF